jgi:hypothetical protein
VEVTIFRMNLPGKEGLAFRGGIWGKKPETGRARGTRGTARFAGSG